MKRNKCKSSIMLSKLIYNNLMWDKRVFRGNTHAALVTLKNVDNQKAQSTSNQRAMN